MIYGSVCSGIEAATVAWHPLGWKPAFFAEIDKFPSAALKHHYPGVPNAGDFTTIGAGDYEPIDLLVGGTPCQDFSVAGLRAGLDGDRGQLTIEFTKLAGRLRPRWLVWENVPGVLSSDGGRAFGAFLGLMGQLGYGFAYRVLDAQHFGVPQRRRRVFVVGHLGDWRRAAAVLFERHSLSGNPAPRRQERETAPTIPSRRTGGGGLGTDFDCDGGLITSNREWPASIAPTLNAHFGDKMGLEDQHALNGAGLFVAHALRAEGFDASEDGTGRGTPPVPVAFNQTGQGWWSDAASAATVRSGDDGGGGGARESTLVAFSAKDYGADASEDISPTLRAGGFDKSHANSGNWMAIQTSMAVRRLTPRECERLQGFPDDYTKINDKTADGPRYKALGNSMAVPCMRWIGERIQMVESL